MQYFVFFLLLPVIALLIVYFFFPKLLFNLGRDALRRRGKIERKEVIVGGEIWPYLEGGPPTGDPVLLIHGFGGDKDNWALYAPFITDKYRLISPDVPGFGDAVRDMNRDYDMATQASRMRDFLDAMGLEKVHIGGNSMGGGISLHFARMFPERVKSLTLFNNAGVIGTSESDLQRQVMTGKNPLEITSADDVTRMMAYIAHKPITVPGQFRKVIYQEFAKHRDLLDKIFWQIAGDGLERPLNDQLPEIVLPTLIIWGRHDQLIDVSCAEVMAAAMPDSELIIFENLGHVPMIEDPANVATPHLQFLAKH